MKRIEVMPLLFLLVVTGLAFIAHSYFFDLGTIHALRGYSVLEYWAQTHFPDHFERDFPGGAGVTRASLITALYPSLVSLTGLPVLIVQYGMIALEVAVFSAGALMLWRVLCDKVQIPDALRQWGGLWLLMVLMLSHMIRPNLANFGFPFFHGQFYGFADGFRLMAIAFALTRRWAFLALALSVGFMIHPIKMMVAAGFITGLILCDWRRSVTWLSVLFGCITVTIMGAWSVLWLGAGEGVLASIPTEDFVAYSRVFQVHWYPVDFGIFDTRHDIGISPFMAVLLMAWLAMAQCPIARKLHFGFSLGAVILLALTAFGVWVSWMGDSTTLIRACLVRASTLLTLLAPFIMLSAMLVKWQAGAWHWVAIYTVFLVSGFEGAAHISAIMAVFAVVLHLYETRKGHLSLILFAALVTLGTAWLAWSVPIVENGFILGGERALYTALGFGLLWLITRVPAWVRLGMDVPKARIAAITSVFLICACLWSYGTRLKPEAYLQKAAAYHQAQIWARDNTSTQALFMVDPCVYYGWRDYAHRASLGTPREWYMTAWGYSGDKALLDRGVAIGRVLGLNMDDYLPQIGQRSRADTHRVCADASDLYYDPSLKNITAIAQAFAVDYFVMQQSKLNTIDDWPEMDTVFENEYYAIYSAREIVK